MSRRSPFPFSAWLLLAAGLWAYHNSFTAPFVFDDTDQIVGSPRVRDLWPPWQFLFMTTRPLVELSFALNYALGGVAVWGYHAVNIAIHLSAALALFGIVRRTLQTPRLSARHGKASTWLALASALLWLVHPLQTASVTYIVQRAEALMGLCYLLTLYSVIRGAASARPGHWYGVAVLACAVGMASKPVMVTAPLAVLLYDRVFLSSSFREAFRSRRGLYLGLSLTWAALLAFLACMLFAGTGPSVGFAVKGAGPLAYALTQPGVILHYLRLAVWPHPLILDYAWPIARTPGEIVPLAAVIAGLLLATGWALRRHPALGFLGAWFFLTLAPSSSVIPLRDPAFEHRMYLPLAAVVVGVVLGTTKLLERLLPSSERARWCLGIGLLLVAAAALATATARRNSVYASRASLWQDTASKRPANPRARYNLGVALGREGRSAEAIVEYREALRLAPGYAQARNNLAQALIEEGELTEAVAHLTELLRLEPDAAVAHLNMANALAQQGKATEALAHYAMTLERRPDDATAHNNMAAVLARQGDIEAAQAHLVEALRLEPTNALAQDNLKRLRAQAGAPPDPAPAP